MKKFHKYIFFLILFFQYFVSNSQSTVYQIDITKEIGSTTWRYLRAGLHQAQEQNAKAIILRLNCRSRRFHENGHTQCTHSRLCFRRQQCRIGRSTHRHSLRQYLYAQQRKHGSRYGSQ